MMIFFVNHHASVVNKKMLFNTTSTPLPQKAVEGFSLNKTSHKNTNIHLEGSTGTDGVLLVRI